MIRGYLQKSIAMFNGIVLVLIIFQLDAVLSKIRVPPNPCPNVFSYYKNPSDEIYGQATVPYDGRSKLEFGVNASMIGYFNKADLRVHLVTPPSYVQQYSELRYNIFFPMKEVVPRITQIKYNDKIYCTGPQESLVPGGPGVTNVWSGHIYSYSAVSNQKEGPTDTAEVVIPNQIEPSQDTSDAELKVVDLNDPNLTNNFQQTNPFLANSQKNTSPQPPKKEEAPIQSNIRDGGDVENNKKYECGVSKNMIVSLILGGEEISEGLFPWLAAMFVSKGNSYEYRCTANLISDRHVVTAAKCIGQFYKVQLVATENLLFVFGKNDISRWATNGAVTRAAIKVQIHPEYDQNSGHGDVSGTPNVPTRNQYVQCILTNRQVITLDKPVVFSNYIIPICLWEGNTDLELVVNTKGTIASWGMDENSKKNETFSTPTAKFVDMPIVSQESCLYSDFSFGTFTSDMTFCAGDKNGNGPCIGDSGAGFMLKRDGKYYLRGLVSLTLTRNGTCDLGSFVIFCDVAKCKDWIQKAMAT